MSGDVALSVFYGLLLTGLACAVWGIAKTLFDCPRCCFPKKDCTCGAYRDRRSKEVRG